MSKCCDKCGGKLCPKCQTNAVLGDRSVYCSGCAASMRRRWTAEEENILRTACSTKYCRGVYLMTGKLLGRKRSCVQKKAILMGLARKPGDAKYPECESCMRKVSAEGEMVIRNGSMYILCRSCAQQLRAAA